MFIKIKGLLFIFANYSNWLTVSLHRLGFFRKKEFIKYRLRQGLVLNLRTRDVDGHIIDNILLNEYFLPEFEISANDTVLDIGANIGAFSLLAAKKAFNGRVIAVEPVGQSFHILEKNIALNHAKNIVAIKKAVFNKKGGRRIFVNYYSGMSNFFDFQKEFEQVSCITLTDLFNKFNIETCDFLKIDAEGSEYEIITSTKKQVLNKIKKLVFEYHPRLSTTNKLATLLKYLKKSGFVLVHHKKMGDNGIIFMKNTI